MKILVTGASGFIGRNVLPVVEKAFPKDHILGFDHWVSDLTNEQDTDRTMSYYEPDVVLHLAGKVGGIVANAKYPVEFAQENLRMTCNIFSACHKFKVKKLVTVIGGCSYPTTAPVPIAEESMWNGYPAKEAAPFSLSKRMTIVLSQAYRKEYDFDSVVLVPGNAYGPYDNFTYEGSHVVPAIIRKMYDAMQSGKDLTLMGSGKPVRDFIYAPDLAAMMPFFIKEFNAFDVEQIGSIINLSSGEGISIANLAESIKTTMGFQGQILWDNTGPEGHNVKVFSVEKMRSLVVLPQPQTHIHEGIQKTVQWFRDNVDKPGAIRL